MKVKIVVDSSADMCTLQDRSVVSVPLTVRTDEKEYIDDAELDIQMMTTELAAYRGRSGSACPGQGDFLGAFEDAEQVYVITITSQLSGSYNAARLAKEEYEQEHPERKVCLIDSLSAGPELKLLVEKLQEWIACGHSFETISKEIAHYQKKTHLVFALKSLTNLANNGRVSPAVAKIAGMLNIHLVGKASLQGELEPQDKVRGGKKSILSLVNNMLDMGYEGGKVRIDHCFNEADASALKNKLLEKFPKADIKLARTHGLCSFYAEQGGLLVGFES